jgi:hypothetical protein
VEEAPFHEGKNRWPDEGLCKRKRKAPIATVPDSLFERADRSKMTERLVDFRLPGRKRIRFPVAKIKSLSDDAVNSQFNNDISKNCDLLQDYHNHEPFDKSRAFCVTIADHSPQYSETSLTKFSVLNAGRFLSMSLLTISSIC